MNGFKPNAKMGNTCHYSHGGAVMKKAKGGKVMGKSYFEDIPDKENDTIDPDDQGSQTYKEINEDMKSGQARYEKLYNRDKSDNNTKVSKKLRMEKMPSGAQQYVRGSTRPEKFQTLSKLTDTQIDKMIAGSDDFPEQGKKAIKLLDAMTDNNDAYVKEVDDYVMKKAKGGAINAKRIANPNMPRPMGGVMGNGPFGPRNPNGPRKPMGSASPMSGGLSSMFKGPMARKKGGMAKGKK